MSGQSSTQIQGTNDSSIASKLSSARKGYFSDDFLQFFVNKCQSRCPLINRGYYIRFKAIEVAFETWFHMLRTLEVQKSQIISLGAGFDSAYFRLKSLNKLPKDCKYVEVDFPEVLLKKMFYINSNKELQTLIEDYDLHEMGCPSRLIFGRKDYTLIGVDMNDIEKLQALCVEAGIFFSLPTLFLSECSITYMDVNRSDALITWVKEKFPNSGFISYEQVYPNDGFGLVMKKHFSTLGSPLKSIDVYPDLLSQRNRFLKMGWPFCNTKLMTEFYGSLPAEEICRIQNLELFDEYETWHQKCSHYTLIGASQGLVNLSPIFEKSGCETENEVKFVDIRNLAMLDANSYMHRFGHQVSFIKDGSLFISGGFGILNNKHQKLKGLFHYSFKTKKTQVVFIDDTDNKLGQRMFHTMTRLRYGILIIGGRSAPSKPYNQTLLLCPHETSTHVDDEESCFESDVLGDSCIVMGKTEFQCMKISEKGCLPSPRWRHTASVVKINGKENVFLFGGSTATKKATNECYLLDTTTWFWCKVLSQENAPAERHSHSSATLEKKIFITGGLSEDEKPMKSVHLFDAEVLSWVSLNVCGLLPRYSHTSHTWKNYLFLLGGVNTVPGVNPFLAMIDLMTLSATEFSMPAQDPEYPILLYDHSSVVHEDKIITVGGGGNCFSFGTHFNTRLLQIDLKSLTSENCNS